METPQAVSLCQCSVTITVKSISWYSENLLCFMLCPLSLSLGTSEKQAISASLTASLQIFIHMNKSPQSAIQLHVSQNLAQTCFMTCLMFKGWSRLQTTIAISKPWTSVLRKVSPDADRQVGLFELFFQHCKSSWQPLYLVRRKVSRQKSSIPL